MNSHYARLACIGLLWALASPEVFAQNAVGDGRALDNNLQQGTGGINPAQPAPVFQGGNDVVTGNVPGLFYFHDDVGYTAPREFRDQLSEDQFFRFQAQSFQPGLGNYMGAGPPMRVYRTMSGATAGEAYQRQTFGGDLSWGIGVYGAGSLIVKPREEGYSPFYGGYGFQPGDSIIHRDSLGLFWQPDGQVWELRASPLLGIRRSTLSQPGIPGYPGYPGLPGRPGDQSAQGEESQLSQEEVAAAIEAQQQLPTGQVPQPQVGTQTTTTAGPSWAPALELGSYLRAYQQGQEPSTAWQQRVTEITSSLFNPLRGVEPVTAKQDAYLDLLYQIQQGSGGALYPQAPPPSVSGFPNQLVTPQAGPAQPEAGLQPPVTAGQPGQGMTQGPLVEPTNPQKAPPVQTPTAAASNPLGDLLATLGYDLPRMNSLAGKRQDIVGQLLREAEADLAADRYFDAERRYRQVLQLSPRYPLGVAGLVHAQLSAGLIRSAALNLRRLFEQHPELIAARYQFPLLPKNDRLQWLLEEIDSSLQQAEEPSLAMLLAYLGYQTDSPDLVTRGLDLAQSKNPKDSLLIVLRKLWLNTQHQPSHTEEPVKP